MSDAMVGFDMDDVRTGEPTRSARLKWVIVVDGALAAGRAVNAAVCVAASTAQSVEGLLGPGGPDSSGSWHPGLPWAGCSILTADTPTLAQVRLRAASHPEVFVADMPAAAQAVRVYDHYLQHVAVTATDELAYAAVSVVGPRKQVDRIVGRLRLLP